MVRLWAGLLLLGAASTAAFTLPHTYRPNAKVMERTMPSPVALLSPETTVALLAEAGEAPQMADGSIFVAVAGGLVAILTAGIPILFLQKEETATVADKLAGLESGVGALEDIEEISSDDSPPTAPKSGSI